MENNNIIPQSKTSSQSSQIAQHPQHQTTIPNLTRTPYKTTPGLASLYPTRPLLMQGLPMQDITTKALTDLSKLYNSEALKFSGEMYDILDTKLKIFREMCCKANVQPYYYHEAFSTMLKGR